MSAVPYTFANAAGQIPASELDVNFANVKAAVDTAGIVTTNAQPNITSVGTLTALSVTGNVASGNVLIIGRVSATGNITGNYFIGNGSQLTGIVATSTYGNSNVTALLADFGSNTISTTGNITTGNVSVLEGGVVSAAGNVRGGNINTAGLVNAGELRVNQTANSWYISGNVISAPSGASWNSNPATLDEFITSAPNGYINLTSLYANSNVASQVHLEHGLAQIVVDNGVDDYIWEFDNTGELTAPGNVSAVGNITAGNVIANNLSGPVFMANVSVGQGVPTSPTLAISQLPLVFDNIIANIGGGYVVGNNTTGSTFTASVSGFYQVSAAIGVTPSNWANVTNYDSAGVVGIYKNGNPVASGPSINFAGLIIGNTVAQVTTNSSVSTLVELNVGDTLNCGLGYYTNAPTNFWNTSTNIIEGYFQACWTRKN